jgi:tetratricopeptide (TPR) repeat protein
VEILLSSYFDCSIKLHVIIRLIWFNTTEKRLEIWSVSSSEPAKIMLNNAENVQQLSKRYVEVQHMPVQQGRFPNNLRAYIKQSGYTIQEIAREADIPLRTLFDYCAGKTAIPRKRLETLADLLAYPIEQIVPISNSLSTIPLIKSDNLLETELTSAQRQENMSGISQQVHVSTQRVVNIIHTDSLLLRVMMLLYQRQYQGTFPNDLQHSIDQEIGGFDLMKQPIDGEESKLSRRDALVMIAGLPLALLVKRPSEPMATIFAEEFLAHCAASITACWHLMRGNQLSVVEEVLHTYLPTLEILAQQQLKYQNTAAKLAAQGYRINGILALHRNNLREREAYCQRAVQYGELAGDPALLVSAFISLASTFYYGQNPIKAAKIYQQALAYQGNISPLLLARIYIELAVVYAQQRQQQEALKYMHLAQELYPEYPEADPSFLYAEFSPSSMILEEGLTHLALAQHSSDGQQYSQQAWKAFARIEQLKTYAAVPERIRVEILNHQATTALSLKDLDAFCDRLEQGVHGAKKLGSEKRRQEAIKVYKDARKIWPDETRVRELADLFV